MAVCSRGAEDGPHPGGASRRLRHLARGSRGIQASLALLGVPLLIESDTAAVLDVARTTYGEPVGGAVTAAARIRIRIVERAPADATPRPTATLTHDDRLVLHGGGIHAEADAARGLAAARVTASALAAPWFRESVLDHLALFLVTHGDRVPLHAAAVVRDGVAMVVAGPSGVGKSSVCYAGVQAGWPVISDDVVFVQLEPTPRLWSVPRPIHLPLAAAEHFPELEGAQHVIRPDGRAKFVLALDEERRAPLPWTGPVALCLVGPGGRELGPDHRLGPSAGAVERLDVEDAAAELRSTLQGGFHRFEHRLGDCVRAVTTAGCWRVPRGRHPRDLLRRLDELPGD